MKKFNIVIVGTLALCAALVFGVIACSNAGGDVSPIVGVGGTQTGGGTTVVNPGDNGGSSGGTGGGAVSGNEKILDLRIKKNGVLYTGAGTSASVSKSLSAANGISFAQAASEQVPGDGWDERLWEQDRYQTSHVKVENAIIDGVKGLKFTITRPDSKYFDPTYLIREEGGWYEYKGQGMGDYRQKGWEYVGEGKGHHILACDNYSWVGAGKGDYVAEGFEYVGDGKGIFKVKEFFDYCDARDENGNPTGDYQFNPPYEYAGEGKGAYLKKLVYNFVGSGKGDYDISQPPSYEYVGVGKGDYKKEGEMYLSVAPNQGDYALEFQYVGEGNGARKKEYVYSFVGDGNGDYYRVSFQCKYVGDGNGYLKMEKKTVDVYVYVGQNQGDYDYDHYDPDSGTSTYKYVGEGNGYWKKVQETYGELTSVGYDGKGDYVPNPEYVGAGKGYYSQVKRYADKWVDWDYDNNKGNGDYLRKVRYVGDGNGDWCYSPLYKYVGDGNGDYIDTFEPVGDGNGDYTYNTNKTYGGWNYVGITRFEDLNGNGDRIWTTRAPLPTGKWNEKVNTCFYPLCEPNERYVFLIELKSIDANFHSGDPDYDIQEFLSIKAQDGIGDIDYSNLDPSRNLEVKYDGEKPIAIVKNCVPPKNTNELLSVLQVFAGNRDWQGDSSHWIADYKRSGDMMQFDKDPCMEMIRRDWTTKDENGNERHYTDEEVENMRSTQCFNAMLKSKGKKEFYVAHYFSFSVPEAQGIEEFRSIYIESEVVPIE